MPDYPGGPINPGAAFMYATRPLALPKDNKAKPIFNFYQGGQSGQGGEVEVIDFMGLVFSKCTNANILIQGRTTGPTLLNPVNLCAAVDIDNAEPGTIISITGVLANAATINANGVAVAQTTPIHFGFIANSQIQVTRGTPGPTYDRDQDDEDPSMGMIQWYIVARAAYGCIVVPAVA